MSACGGGYIVDMLSVKVFVTHLLSTGSVSFIILKKNLITFQCICCSYLFRKGDMWPATNKEQFAWLWLGEYLKEEGNCTPVPLCSTTHTHTHKTSNDHGSIMCSQLAHSFCNNGIIKLSMSDLKSSSSPKLQVQTDWMFTAPHQNKF